MKRPEPVIANKLTGRKNLPAKANALIADAQNDITIPFFTTVLQPIDDTLIQRGSGRGLAIYDEIERDTHAWAVLQKRKHVLLGREWEVEPGGEDQADIDAADFVRECLKALPFDRICGDLLDATLKGFSISEVVWQRAGQNILANSIVSQNQRRFVFDLDWKPRLLTRFQMMEGEQLPERKFIVHRFGVKGNNPYGLGLGTRLFWPVLFKREGVGFWMKFLEKFATPTVIGKTPYGMLDDQQRKLLDSLAGFVQNSAITVPIGTEVDLLEASRAGAAGYEDWCKYWDKQISICVLGETLTTDIGDNGSRAASETHSDMLQMLVDADGDLLADTLQQTLIRWLVEYNHPGAGLPKVWRLRPQNEAEAAEVRQKKAKASKDENEALVAVVRQAARIEDDALARDYIIAFSPRDLEEPLLDGLVTNRHLWKAETVPAGTGENDDEIAPPKLPVPDPAQS